MNEHFKTITDALILEGFPELTDKIASRGQKLDYNLTPYSLNTKLSFRFDNLAHFIEFLNLHNPDDVSDKQALLKATLMELDLDPEGFFWVNFFGEREAEV
ncbi:MAG TPA: hypothetical protein PLS51_03960 [Flavobacterium sp.]|jgi:hypothetical protein|nr:hypothetical protein [Flavobacterium sp.]HPJ09761.1 hypothetical protein [Flavobacterium sp.]